VTDVLIAVLGVIVIGAFSYAITATRGTAPRPRSPEGRRIERSVTIATVIEPAAAIVLPVIVSGAGHSDWVLPLIAIAIGPLLLWLDHRVHVPRYRPVGWRTVHPRRDDVRHAADRDHGHRRRRPLARYRGCRLPRSRGQVREPFEPAGQVPVPIAEQLHHRGYQHGTDDCGVIKMAAARPTPTILKSI
jgi:hypothetical protein